MEKSEKQSIPCSSSVNSCTNFPPTQSCLDECVSKINEDNNDDESFGSRNSDFDIDLELGLKFRSSTDDSVSKQRERRRRPDWPLINPIRRKTFAGKSTFLFVKVNMEGIPIGRKLNLYEFDGYEALLTAICHMFEAFVFCGVDADGVRSGKHHYVLTYEDEEGDWMMVGDIPWEMFVSTVKRLKITRRDSC